MSDRDYIAWSLLFAGAFAVLLAAMSGAFRYVDRRRRVALGLGPAREYRQRFKLAYPALYAAFALLVGLYVAHEIAQPLAGTAPPRWSAAVGRGLLWMPVLGVVLMLDSFQPASDNAASTRAVGIMVLVVGAFGVGMAFWGYPA